MNGPVGEAFDSAADRRPDEDEHGREGDGRERGDDRHRALPREEAEIARELHPVEAVEHRRGNEPYQDPAEDTRLDRGETHDGLGLDAEQSGEYAHRCEEDGVSHGARERGDAVVLGEPDGHADREEQRQASEDHAAGSRHHLRDGCPAATRSSRSRRRGGCPPRAERRPAASCTCRSAGGGRRRSGRTSWSASSTGGWFVVRVGDESTHLFGGLGGESTLGELPAGVETKAADLRLDGGDRRQAHAELVHAEAEEDGHRAPITGNAPADSHRTSPGNGRPRPCARSGEALPGSGRPPAERAWDVRGPWRACIA